MTLNNTDKMKTRIVFCAMLTFYWTRAKHGGAIKTCLPVRVPIYFAIFLKSGP